MENQTDTTNEIHGADTGRNKNKVHTGHVGDERSKAARSRLDAEVSKRFFPRHWRVAPLTSAALRSAGQLAFGDRLAAIVNATAPPL